MMTGFAPCANKKEMYSKPADWVQMLRKGSN
jgi:hypothetical protein